MKNVLLFFGAAVLLSDGCLQQAQAASTPYNLVGPSDRYSQMTFDGGAFHSYFSSGTDYDGTSFHWQPTVSPITSFVPGVDFEWEYIGMEAAHTLDIRMTLPDNLFLNPVNPGPLPRTYNGNDFRLDHVDWVADLIEAGALFPNMEYSVAFPDIPEGVIYDNFNLTVRSGYQFSQYNSSQVLAMVTTVMLDSNGQVMRSSQASFLPGETVTYWAIVIGDLSDLRDPPYGTAIRYSANMEVHAIPEPSSIALSVALLGLALMTRQWRGAFSLR